MESMAANEQCPARLGSWPVNLSSCWSCWLVTFNCIENEMHWLISMLFSCCQYVASCCVLPNSDLNPGRNVARNFVYNLCIETGIRVPALLVTKLRIFSLLSGTQRLFSGLLIGCGKKNFTGFSGTDWWKNQPILREVVEIFGVKFTDKQQLRILNVDKTTSKWL